jgi:hypothetical protein
LFLLLWLLSLLLVLQQSTDTKYDWSIGQYNKECKEESNTIHNSKTLTL